MRCTLLSAVQSKVILKRYFDPAAADTYSPDTRHGTVQEVQNDGNKQAIIQRKHLKKKLNDMPDPI